MFLALWLRNSNLCLHLHMAFSVCLSIPLLCLLRILVIGFRDYLGNPGWSHLDILNLITSAKTLLLSEITFSSSGRTYLWGSG